MARDRASIRIDMWADEDWREVSGEGQRLYMQLLSHPTLSYAGVATWHPGRLAAMTGDLSPSDIERAGAELVNRFFIVIDAVTEEVLVRSFVKHDGLMKQPKLVVSMTNAFAAVASKTLREVIAFEAQKLRVREPDLKAWEVPQTQTVLKATATDAHSLSPTVTPLFTPAVTPSGGQAQGLPTATTTSTATEASLPAEDEKKKPEVRLPKDWAPNASHIERAKELGVDVLAQADAFKLHAETYDRHLANWNAGFTTWLKKATPSTPARTYNRDAWMQQL